MKITDKIYLICTHNIQFMSTIDNNSFDLGFIDAEYGISINKQTLGTGNKKYSKIKNWDKESPSFYFFSELFRVTKNQIIFGANYYYEIVGNPFKPPRRIDFDLFLKNNPTNWIIWDKMNGTNDFNDCELIYTSFEIKSFIIKYMWNGMMQGSSQNGEIAEGNKKLNETRIHPTQKPTRIYKKILHELRLDPKNILDTNSGSGTLALVCHDLDISFVGIEKEKDYHFDSVMRIRDHIKIPIIRFN